jgi:hypothetical protein
LFAEIPDSQDRQNPTLAYLHATYEVVDWLSRGRRFAHFSAHTSLRRVAADRDAVETRLSRGFLMLSRLVRVSVIAGALFFVTASSATAGSIAVCITDFGSSTCLGTKTVTTLAVPVTFDVDVYATGLWTSPDEYVAFILDRLKWSSSALTLNSATANNALTPNPTGVSDEQFNGPTTSFGEGTIDNVGRTLEGTSDTFNGTAVKFDEGSLFTLHFTAAAFESGDVLLEFETLFPNGPIAFYNQALDSFGDPIGDEAPSSVLGATIRLEPAIAPVPEPGTITLVGFGALSLGTAVRKRLRRRSTPER